MDHQGVPGAVVAALGLALAGRGGPARRRREPRAALHDRTTMVLMAKTLLDGGARLDVHNVWGDTPYSIAKAPRYCGPDHPVTQMIRTECYAGFRPQGDRCLEDYRPHPKAD